VIVGGKDGARLVNLEKPWRRIRDRVTVGLWRDGEDATVAGLVAQLADKLDREPTIDECRKAAREAKIELPVGMTDVRLHDLRHNSESRIIPSPAAVVGKNPSNFND
jgi:hypothetical protein